MADNSRLSASIRNIADQLSSELGSRVAYRTGTVHSVTAGASADGHAAVVVTVDGNDVPAPYLTSYTPTVGDLVMVVLVDGSPLILGKLIGFPVV